jgi:AraC-like DNA-binding protein
MATRSLEIRAESLNAQSVGRANILDAWREATSPVYDAVPVQQREDFDASIVAFNLDGLVVSHVRFDPSYFGRSPARLRNDETDCITIQHYLSGSIQGHVGDRPFWMGPDRISIQDLALPYSARAEASEVLGLAIPRHRVRASQRLRTQQPLISFPLNTARGSLLAGALQGLWKELSAGRVYQPASVADAFLGFVNGLIEHAVDAPPDDQSLAAMEEYLRERLNDDTLGVEDIERAFHYSRSAIYRLFEPHGGVAAFIRTERLRQCHAELIRPRATPISVSDVAGRFGFHDASHFSRVFRRHYGIAPSELAAFATRNGVEHSKRHGGRNASVRTIKSWLEAL